MTWKNLYTFVTVYAMMIISLPLSRKKVREVARKKSKIKNWKTDEHDDSGDFMRKLTNDVNSTLILKIKNNIKHLRLEQTFFNNGNFGKFTFY